MTNSTKLYYKTCREQSGLTQEQAVLLLGIAETSTLSKYENGHLSVSQELAAAMVKAYRTPTLAWWYVRHTLPDLAPYLQESPPLVTDGDMMLHLELSQDDMSEIRGLLKNILRDGRVSPEEAEDLKVSAKTLRMMASKLMESAGYLEERQVDV